MMQINGPMREYQFLSESIDRAILEVVRSGRWLFGESTEKFAQDFASYIGVNHVVLVGNGTDALELALRGAGVGPGDEVITAPNAGGYTTVACRIIGAIPVYADIAIPGMTVDPASVIRLLSPRVKVVVVTHLYGNLGNVDKLRLLLTQANREDVVILEDCAQAHGAKQHGRTAGSLGDIATFSFYPSKNLGALGDAGAVVTNRQDFARNVRLLHQYGWEPRYRSILPYGRNSRIDEIQAAVLNVKLTHLDAMNSARRLLLKRYRSSLPAGYQFCTLDGEASVAHLAVLHCPKDRDMAMRHLQHHEIETAVHYPVLDCDQPAWVNLPMRYDDISNCRKAVPFILSLPCAPHMSETEVQIICNALETLP